MPVGPILVSVVRVLDLDGAAHVELAVEPLVVPPPHQLERCELDLLERVHGPCCRTSSFLLEVVDGLRHRVIERVADRAGQWDRAGFYDPLGVNNRGVVRAVVRVMDQPVGRPLTFQAAMSRACIGRVSDRSVDATFPPTMRRD